MDLGDDSEQLIFRDESSDHEGSPTLKLLKKGIQAQRDSSMASLFQDDEDFDISMDSPKLPDTTNAENGPVESDPKSFSPEKDKESEELENLNTDLEDDSEQLIIRDEYPNLDRSPKLRRLKKGVRASRESSMGSQFRDDEDFINPIDPFKSPDSTKSDGGPAESDPGSATPEGDRESEEFDRLFPWEGEEKQGAKRALNFSDANDDTDVMVNGIEDTEKGEAGESDHDWDGFWENNNEKRKRDEGSEDEINEGKQKKKTKKGDKTRRADSERKLPKRKVKEETAQFANFQRELRERKDVAFKPVFVAPKPISSVLEKIRQRKLNLSKKRASFSSNMECNGHVYETVVDAESEDVPIIEGKDRKEGRSMPIEPDTQQTAKADHPSSPSNIGNADSSPQLSSGQTTTITSLEVEDNQQAFRAPADDTQDLYPESETRNSQDEDHSDKDTGTPRDEDMVPSLPSMNLKLDSAPAESDDDEDYSDKENTNPSSELSLETDSPPKGDPVKAFVDEEASEEDDSDDDKLRFGDEEEEDDDAEEVADLIATNYNEKPVDHEMRNELHQKWLEQQDEAGTDNLLHKYVYRQGEVAASLQFDEEETNAGSGEADNDEVDGQDDDAEEIPNTNFARFSTKQLRQMIPKMYMYPDNDDGGYVSSEDEETEKRLVKQQVLGKLALEEKISVEVGGAAGTSREVSGRARKLTTVHETRKKTKITSFFEASLIRGKMSSSSTKSSFLHRATSIPVTRKKTNGSGVTRGFIFGRDDSNSRSSFAVAEEESSEVIDPSNKPKRLTHGAKFGGSQARLGSQSFNSSETSRGSLSLFDVLSRSSAHSRDSFAAEDETIDQQAIFAAMKATAMRSLKVETRT